MHQATKEKFSLASYLAFKGSTFGLKWPNSLSTERVIRQTILLKVSYWVFIFYRMRIKFTQPSDFLPRRPLLERHRVSSHPSTSISLYIEDTRTNKHKKDKMSMYNFWLHKHQKLPLKSQPTTVYGYLIGISAVLKPFFDARHAIYVSTRETTELIQPQKFK